MTSNGNILVINQLPDKHIDILNNISPNINIIVTEPSNAQNFLDNIDILVAGNWNDISNIIKLTPNLKWIHSLSAGVENLLLPEIVTSNIILTNSRGIHGIPVSEHVLALMLAFTRGLNLSIKQQIAKIWKLVPTDDIYNKVIAIIGLGSIGREIAKKAKGLGMKVLATRRNITEELFIDKMFPADNISDMLSLADFVVIALPLTQETKEMFRLEHFKLMKPTAYFINISRGAIVNEDDLIAALDQGIIKGAGLNVSTNEPLPETSPLWTIDNVIITPHLAAVSPYYLDRAIQLFVDNLERYLNGQEMFNLIDKQKGY